MLSDADNEGVDKLLFSQGKHRGSWCGAATLTQPSERAVTFGVLQEWGFHHPHARAQTCIFSRIHYPERSCMWLCLQMQMQRRPHVNQLQTLLLLASAEVAYWLLAVLEACVITGEPLSSAAILICFKIILILYSFWYSRAPNVFFFFFYQVPLRCFFFLTPILTFDIVLLCSCANKWASRHHSGFTLSHIYCLIDSTADGKVKLLSGPSDVQWHVRNNVTFGWFLHQKSACLKQMQRNLKSLEQHLRILDTSTDPA